MKRDRRRAMPSRRLFAEHLEPRGMLSVSGLAPAFPSLGSDFNPAAAFPVVAAPTATTPAASAGAMPVAVVRSGDPLYGYEFTAVTTQRAFGYGFADGVRSVQADVAVTLVDLPLGSALQLQVLTGLTSWNGRGEPSFSPVRGALEVNLRASGHDLRVGAKTDQSLAPRGGIVRHSIDVAVSDGLALARRIEVTIGSGGVRDAFERPGAPAGIYAFTGLWSVRGAAGIRDSAPVTFVFAAGDVGQSALDRAVASFSAASTRPVAIVAVASEVVEVDGSGRQSLRVNVQYSDPVTATGRSPQLPVLFDSTMRLADLERSSPRTNVTTLTFSLVPTQQERQSRFVRLGDSLRLPSGGSLASSYGGASILSLPGGASGIFPIELAPSVSVVSADITRNTTFTGGTTYIIDGEIHVRSGVTLTIEDGVTVLIRNGRSRNRLLDTNALIFDTGSSMRAKTVFFKAADGDGRPATLADNGGVFFLGSTRDASKDGVSVDTRRGAGRSSFTADLVVASYLGRTDPLLGDGDDADRDDIDAISVLGMGRTEWRVKAVRSEHSGDDGFDATNSSIQLDSLVVVNPIEDGLNLSSSLVEICRELTVVMSRSRVADRELFDLEVASGPARVLIQRQVAVDLRGAWGNVYDEVSLNSPDMPQPSRRGGENQWYEFTGILRKGPAIVYSLRAD